MNILSFRNILFIVMIAFLLSTTMLYAQEDNTGEVKPEETPSYLQDIRARLQKQKTTKFENVEEKRDVVEVRRLENEDRTQEIRSDLGTPTGERRGQTEGMDDRAKDRIRAYMDRMLKRMEAALERFDKFIERIDSRIDKFTERGVDTTEVEGLLEETGDGIEAAKAELQSVRSTLETTLESDNPKEAFKAARDSIISARDLIKEVHASLVEVVKLLKGAASDETEDDETTDEE